MNNELQLLANDTLLRNVAVDVTSSNEDANDKDLQEKRKF